MANKELTARVKLDSRDAESKLKRLHQLIQGINKAVTGHNNTSQLETKLSRELITAEKVKQATLKTAQHQEKLSQEIGKTFVIEQKVDQAIAKTATEQEKVKQAVSKTAQEIGKEFVAEERVNQALIRTDSLKDKIKRKIKEIKSSTENWVKSLNKATGKLTQCKSIVGALTSKMGRLASLIFGVGSIKLAITGADTLTGAQNRFNNIAAKQMGDSAYTKDASGNITGYSDKALSFTQDTMDKIYTSAMKTRTEYADMLSNVSKTMTLAPDAFQGNIDNAIRFQEIMAEAYAVGGASAQEMSTSMYQLTQALGAGVLAGDELRSVREGAPLAYQKIEEFAQGVYNTSESLKDLAADGKITSDMVVAAVMNMGSEMDTAFALTKYRFSDVWNQIKSAAQKSFEPVVQMMTDKLNEAVDNGLIQKFENFFTNVAKFVMIVFKVVENVVTWIADNWGWLRDVIVGALILIAAYETALIAARIAHAITDILLWKAENEAAFAYLLTIIKIIAVIAVIIIAIYLLYQTWSDFANGAITLCNAIIQTLAILGVAIFIIGLIVGSTTMAAVGIIIFAVGVIIQYLEYVLAFIYSVIALVWNAIVGVINAIIQAVYAVGNIILSVVEWVLNICNGGFNSFGGAVANLIGQIIGWFLSLGQVVTKIIDAIFGTNWTAGLESLKSKVISWGKNENSITLTKEAPTIQTMTGGAVDRWAYGNAWNTGIDHGLTAKNAVNNWGSQFQNQSNVGAKSSWLDRLGKELGLTDEFNNLTNNGAEKTISPDSVDDLLKNVGNTADNTDKMADSMELAEEDLAFLRKLADSEWKKEYTTASITVDMSNYNTINGESDLDGIVTKLGDKLREELNVVANGLYT